MKAPLVSFQFRPVPSPTSDMKPLGSGSGNVTAIWMQSKTIVFDCLTLNFHDLIEVSANLCSSYYTFLPSKRAFHSERRQKRVFKEHEPSSSTGEADHGARMQPTASDERVAICQCPSQRPTGRGELQEGTPFPG